jgi:hypothetical protein
MICIELALTAQLFCYSDHTFVCADNGSLAKLIGVSACTGPGRPRVLAIPVITTDTPCECASPDYGAIRGSNATVIESRLQGEVDQRHSAIVLEER